MVSRRKVGRVRIKLAEKLQEQLRAIGVDCDVYPEDLLAAEGYYRIGRYEECYRWTGVITVRLESGGEKTCLLDSWDTMTDCVKAKRLQFESEGKWGYWPIMVSGT